MANAYVYIFGNKGGMLYIGVTNDLERRVYEHKTKAVPGYTSKFSIHQLGTLKNSATSLTRSPPKSASKGGGAAKSWPWFESTTRSLKT